MFGWGAGEPARKRFLYLSGEYFRREMQREFRFEAIAFAAIVAITAWPLISLRPDAGRLIRSSAICFAVRQIAVCAASNLR